MSALRGVELFPLGKDRLVYQANRGFVLLQIFLRRNHNVYRNANAAKLIIKKLRSIAAVRAGRHYNHEVNVAVLCHLAARR